MVLLFLFAAAANDGINPQSFDKSVSACDDFYQYSCGSWLKQTPIPPDQAAWGSFSILQEQNLATLHDLLDGLAKNPPSEPAEKKLADYYATCMDESIAEKGSPATLKATLADIDKVKSTTELAALVGKLHLQGSDVFFSFGSGQDFKDAEKVIGQADQGGLGLPEREYYLKTDAESVALRDEYSKHLERLLTLTGDSPAVAKKSAATILKFETALAKASMPIVDLRDPQKIYHRLDRKGLTDAAPKFAWNEYFKAIGADVQPINVSAPGFFTAMSSEVAKAPLADLKVYVRAHVIGSSAMSLGKAYVDEAFSFSRRFSGLTELPVRWKRCVQSSDAALGDVLGKLFVQKTFGEDGKQRARAMIQNIEHAFQANLGPLEWMDDATKKESIAKLQKVVNKIGYPDKWRDYSTLEVSKSSHLQNRLAATVFENTRQLSKIGKPLDRNDWDMTPPTVNADYSPTLNEMAFPAGILQPPFFFKSASEPVNYGAIGVVMGHELTHGYDDEGRQFDGAGNMRDWWSPTIGKRYEEKAACIAKQYDAYEPVPGTHLNGKLTLGENIADLGGMRIAYQAMREANKTSKPATVQGFTPDQQFFVAFAQAWCELRRPEFEKTLAATDPHSPSRFRTNGVMSNLPEFAKAFNCKPGAPMAPVNRCGVW